jgi:hypothetical protein
VFYTGKRIVEPKSTCLKWLGRRAITLRSMISPYATFGPTVQRGTSKGAPLEELGKQLFDIKVPTAREQATKVYVDRKLRQDAAKRLKRPQGLLEEGVKQLERAIK